MRFNGYSYEDILDRIKEKKPDLVLGESIKEHTIKKIEYMKKYVEQWLFVLSNVSKKIYFIDIMSNAGVYVNNHLTTSIEVLNVFVKTAQAHPDVIYYLLCNDYDANKIETVKFIYNMYRNKFKEVGISNIKLIYNNADASDYLAVLERDFSNQFTDGKMRSILLYVDPYNYISLKLANSIYHFVKNTYCEMILNYDSNDFIRNINHPTAIEKRNDIRALVTNFCGFDNWNKSEEEVRNKLKEKFVSETKLMYKYEVKMMTTRNGTLYYLIYFTPSLKGLEKIKDATWKVFGFHNDFSASRIDRMTPDLFNCTDETDAFDDNLKIVKNYLKNSSFNELSYDSILVYCLENTVFPKGKVIEKVIKPLLEDKVLIKKGLFQKNNYTKDLYIIVR